VATVGSDNVPNGPMPRREQAIQIIEGAVERSINRRIHVAKLSGEYSSDFLDLLRVTVPDDMETMLVDMLEKWDETHAKQHVTTVEVTEVSEVTIADPNQS
jgi:hypothetical protein